MLDVPSQYHSSLIFSGKAGLQPHTSLLLKRVVNTKKKVLFHPTLDLRIQFILEKEENASFRGIQLGQFHKTFFSLFIPNLV